MDLKISPEWLSILCCCWAADGKRIGGFNTIRSGPLDLLPGNRRATAARGLFLSHTGGWPGYQTLLYRFQEKNRVPVILSNRVHPDNLREASQNLADLLPGV